MGDRKLSASGEFRDFGSILAVDDERDFVDSLVEVLAATGFSAEATTDPRDALDRLTRGDYALLIVDLVMPEMDGMELLRRTREASPDTEVVIATGYGTIESAVEAIRAGAADFLTKPFESRKIVEVIGRVMEMRRLRIENRQLREELGRRSSGESPPGAAVREAFDVARDRLNCGALDAESQAEGVREPFGEARPLADIEREAIAAALNRSSGNLSRAARELGVSRTSLYDRIARYRLPRPDEFRARRKYAERS